LIFRILLGETGFQQILFEKLACNINTFGKTMVFFEIFFGLF